MSKVAKGVRPVRMGQLIAALVYALAGLVALFPELAASLALAPRQLEGILPTVVVFVGRESGLVALRGAHRADGPIRPQR
ncbi:MAG: hypothetical protein H0X16_05490 [Chloroflexi bacterium]|nr:hypothetical protein [Chloroflexota bacterium]